jgi:hypothetical protein
MEIRKINSQAEAVLYFIEKLDVEMVNDLLDPNKTYSDLDKEKFIRHLAAAFNTLIEAGDTCTTKTSGVCTGVGCDNIGCMGYSFLGDRSGLFLDLVVIEKNGKIEDIFDCAQLDIEQSNRNGENRVRVS